MPNLKSKLLQDKSHTRLRRKRLGQFFTGAQLARLLAALADAKHAGSAIDPMVGIGDMLEAVHDLNPKTKLSGIEIDADVLAQAQIRLAAFRPTLTKGNAFSHKNLAFHRKGGFDLVITNPPYVRYQGFAKGGNDRDIPDAAQVRRDLLANVDLLADPEDQSLFREIIKAYSGLSDLAVPAWILSAMLTSVGGTLALVVPESWLSRDYAQVVQYILLRWFKIKYIVEDSNASWFPDALVKTTLLVAKRIPRRDSAFSWGNDTYAHVKISADAATPESVVGNIYPNALFPEQKFAEEITALLLKNKKKEARLWSSESSPLSEMANRLRVSTSKGQWLKKIENIQDDVSSQAIVPEQIRRMLGDSKVELKTLAQMGARVGQGLRTGANSFFYTDLIRDGKVESVVQLSKVFNASVMTVPRALLKVVIRKQAELPDGYVVRKSMLKGRVLLIPNGYRVTGDIANFIHKAAHTRAGSSLIPDLSAVKTNVRVGSEWYMLPSLAQRHTPQLFVPRINGATPKTYLNSPGLVVDANFSTIWLERNSHLTPEALLALLNSSWSIAIMELSGAVMGGGALKLEATHIKRIPFPVLDKTQIKRLDELGRELTHTPDSAIVRHIDEVVLGAFFKKSLLQENLQHLGSLIGQRRKERKKRS